MKEHSAHDAGRFEPVPPVYFAENDCSLARCGCSEDQNWYVAYLRTRFQVKTDGNYLKGSDQSFRRILHLPSLSADSNG